MKKNSTEEATTFTPPSRPFPHQSRSSCIVKNALIDDINTMNVHNTSAIIVIDERRDIKYRTALTGIIEVGDFNYSGGYCYELLSSLTHADHAFSFYFSSMIKQMLTIRQACLLHMHTSLLPYDLHVFTSWLTHFFYLFKPVVRRLYSLAFHWEF